MKKAHPLFPVFITVFIDLLGVGIMIPVFAPLIVRNEYGVLPATTSEHARNILYGFLTAVFPFFQFFGAPLLGSLADRFGRKKILLLSLLGTFIGYVLFACSIHAQVLWLVFIARAIPGFMGGNISIVMAALADISSPQDKAKNFGLIGMAFGLGFIFGPVIGGLLADRTVCAWFDFSTPLWFTALLTLVNIVFVIRRFPETYKPSGSKPFTPWAGIRNLQHAFAMRHLRVLMLSIFLMSFGFCFFTQFFSVYVIKKFDFTQKDIGFIFGFVGVCIALVQGVLTRLASRKFLPEQILRVSLFIFSLALIGMVVPDSVFFLYFFNVFIAIGQGLSQPNFSSLFSSMADKDAQGEILGIQQSMQSFALIIPPLIAGFIVNIDYRLPMVVSALCLLLSWGVFYFCFQKK